jgi:hypothetical protein
MSAAARASLADEFVRGLNGPLLVQYKKSGTKSRLVSHEFSRFCLHRMAKNPDAQ